MDDNILLERIKQCKNDKEKIELISRIQNNKTKIIAITLLEDDSKKIQLAELFNEDAYKAKIYRNVIRNNESFVEQIVKCINSFNLDLKLLIMSEIPNSQVETKINLIADLLFDKECKYDERNKVIRYLHKIYDNVKNENFGIVDFMSILKNDDTIANVIPMFKMESTERKTIIDRIKDQNVRETLEFLESSESLKGTMANMQVEDLTLPETMTIGVELEAEGKMFGLLYNQKALGRWETKDDDSLENGVEVVSPVLRSTTEDIKELYMVCDIMKKYGLESGERCGGHIHIGADFLDSTESLQTFLVLWLANEESIYGLSNEAGKQFRSGVEQYAKPVSHLYDDSNEIIENVKNAKSRDELIGILQQIQTDGHHSGLNLDNINNRRKNTIEFRVSNGTLEANEIVNNIRLYGRLMQRAKEVSVIQKQKLQGKEVSQEEQQKLSEFQKICEEDLPQSEKSKIFIDFLFEEGERDVYTERQNASIQNSENVKKLFSKTAYKKLYESLKPKDKDFHTTLSELKDDRISERNATEIEQ